MRVLYVKNSFGNCIRGGAEIQFENSIKAFQQFGIECHIVNPEYKFTENIDLVHIFQSHCEYIPVIQWASEKNIPIVMTPIYYPSGQYFLTSLLYETINRLGIKKGEYGKRLTLWQNSDIILPNTLMEANFFSSILGISKNITVVHNCIEDDYFREKNNFTTPKKNFVLSVGRIEHRKNQYRLIKACMEHGFPLMIIGKIRDKKYWEKCLSLGYSSLEHRDSIWDRNELIKLYQECKIFALPSTMETPGLAALEAAAEGATILITQNGGTKEYFENYAYYVDPKRQNEINHELRAAWQEQKVIPKIFLMKYKYEEMAIKTIKIYNQLLEERKSRA
jgi:glycosyltransferase involved in cell wall biosynthesis